MQEHILFLQRIAAEHTFEQFAQSTALQYACRYALLIIAEAANRLRPDLRDRASDVPWRSIISIGNKLRHEYFRVDQDVIWDTIENHLGQLDAAIAGLLADEEVL